jgi:pimeloyl-ACP methyl ester carboxylesterase
VVRQRGGSYDSGGASYRLIRTGFGPGADPRLVRFGRDVAASVPPQVRADTFRAMREFDLRPALAEIRVPSLVLFGGRDRLVPPDEARLLGSLLSRSRPEEFPDSGHALFLEEADRFDRLVDRFASPRLGRAPAKTGRKPARTLALGGPGVR